MNIDSSMDFEELDEVYGAFPLKAGFLEAGNLALEKFGLTAVQNGNTVRIHFLSKPYFTAEDIQDLKDNDFEEDDIAEFKRWTIEGEALIRLSEGTEKRVLETDTDYQPDHYGGKEDDFEDLYDRVTVEDENRGLKVIAAFLDAAVDTDSEG